VEEKKELKPEDPSILPLTRFELGTNIKKEGN